MPSSGVTPSAIAEILDSTPAIIWVADATTFAFTYVNQAAQKILGYETARWLEPHFWRDHIHPDDRGVIAACHSEVVAGHDHELVYRMIAADGRFVTLRDKVQVHHDDHGNVIEISGAMFDVTAEQRAHDALAESEETYRLMVDSSPDAIGVHADGSYIYVNPRFVELFGARDADEVIGRDLYAFVHPAFVDVVRQRQELLSRGEPVPLMHEKLVRMDGGVIDAEVAAHPMVFHGRPAVQVVFRDMAERMHHEERLRLLTLAEGELEDARRMATLGELAASIAHEFNNVLMSIAPFAEILLRTGNTSPQLVAAQRHIADASARGKRITHEILEFANPKEPQAERLEGSEWLAGIAASIRAALPENITLTFAPNAEATILGDRHQLAQIVTNLVFNARDAMLDGGVIRLELAVDGDAWRSRAALDADRHYARISVRDSGTGIPEAILPSIFDALFTTKRNGTGLGLAITKRLIEHQHGAIVVDTDAAGTSFHLLLPMAEGEARREEKIPPVPRHKIERIVLAEDDVAVAEAIVMMLDLEGVSCLRVERGEEVFAAVDSFHPNAVVLDLNLPQMNGFEVRSKLRVLHPHLPVVISTGHVIEQLSEANTQTILKPYTSEELLEACYRACASPAAN